MLDDRQPDGSPFTIELRTGDRPIVIEARDGAIQSRLGPADNPDAILTPPTPILGLHGPADAEAHGIAYHGDPALLDRVGADVLPTAPQRGAVIP